MNRLFLAIAPWLSVAVSGSALGQSWEHVGGDIGGQRSSAAHQITRDNVGRLSRSWTYSTGDARRLRGSNVKWKFQATPILADGRLYLCTPFNDVVALDPGNGKELWRYQAKLADIKPAGNGLSCRGVTYWKDPKAGDGEPCQTRIVTGTNDMRLVALDARSGRPCITFGDRGTITIDPGKPLVHRGEVQITSPPVVVKGVVVVGSAIGDNMRVDAPRGTVRAFDVRTGAPLWTFDPIPHDPGDPARATWPGNSADLTGQANVWSLMSGDEQRGLVFLPTSSPSVDHYGGTRPGDNRYANSVVALDARTGRIVWNFQTVHHDLWDYDVSAQPTLATIERNGHLVDALIQPTKMGLIFTFDRATGKPLFEIVERPVPRGDVPGEWYSPTQPFPTTPRMLVPNQLKPKDVWGLTPFDRGACRRLVQKYRYEGPYTPPSLQGTIHYPFISGGVNWGSAAFDARAQTLYVVTNNATGLMRLVPRESAGPRTEMDVFRDGIAPQTGTPYVLERTLLASPFGAPCNPPPWGQLHAIEMRTGKVLWERPLGTLEDFVPLGNLFLPHGSGNMGGPIVTSGGLLFVGAAMDNYLRAFDMRNGDEVWKGRLPAGGQATPMTYIWKGRQFVLIAAGGHEVLGTSAGDTLVAFALDQHAYAWQLSLERHIHRPTTFWLALLAAIIVSGVWARRIYRRRRTRPKAKHR